MALSGEVPACWTWPAPDLGEFGDIPADDDLRWFMMMNWHEDRCAACGQTRNPKRLRVDHDHYSGWIRGLLCPSCNQYESFGNTPLFDRYRERPPAVMWGAQFQYWVPSVVPTAMGREGRDEILLALSGDNATAGRAEPRYIYVPPAVHYMTRAGDGDEPREEVWQCQSCPRRQTIIPDRLADGAWITRIWHDRGNYLVRHLSAVQDSLF
jgi:hypothetical protein